MLRRINTPFCNNCYCLPGGEIRPGENATNTAIREAQASLNITITQDDLEFVHVMHRKCHESEFFACIFKIKNYAGKISNHDQNRYNDLAWFNWDDLPIEIVPAHKQATTVIKQNISYSEHGW